MCRIVDFVVPVDYRVKIKESKKRDEDIARELRMLMKMTVFPIVFGAVGMIIKSLVSELEELEIGGRVIKIGQNTEKSHGDLKGLAIIQTPVKDHQLTPVWKTRK